MATTPKKRAKAIAYLRTSSATNVDGDSAERQRAAIRAYAARAGLEVVEEFYDAAVSGADPIENRPGFAAMLDRIEGNGVRTVLVEDASRFARDLMVQELGLLLMQRRGVTVLTASGENLTDTVDPARKMMRQVAGAFAEYEKARLVAKLRGARDRLSAAQGRRVEGRKPVLTGEALALARRLRRRNPRTGERRSYRDIAAALAKAGHINPATGRPFTGEGIRLALEGAACGAGQRGVRGRDHGRVTLRTSQHFRPAGAGVGGCPGPKDVMPDEVTDPFGEALNAYRRAFGSAALPHLFGADLDLAARVLQRAVERRRPLRNDWTVMRLCGFRRPPEGAVI